MNFCPRGLKIRGVLVAAGSPTTLTKSLDLHDYRKFKVDAGLGPYPRTPPPAADPAAVHATEQSEGTCRQPGH